MVREWFEKSEENGENFGREVWIFLRDFFWGDGKEGRKKWRGRGMVCIEKWSGSMLLFRVFCVGLLCMRNKMCIFASKIITSMANYNR